MSSEGKVPSEPFTAYVVYSGRSPEIRKVVGHLDPSDPDVLLVDEEVGQQCFYLEGRHWHRTPEGALKAAEKMRDKAIQAFQEQIDILKAITFKIV
jgi:hypothetical protein